MKPTIAILVCILALSSCTLSDLMWPSTTTITSSGKTTPINIGTGDIQSPLVEDLSGSGDLYSPIFNGLQTKVIRIKHTSRVPTTIAFINSEAKSVEVSITFLNATGSNLRWSQVILPDGTMDGPFGQKIGYNLKQLWGYQFIFNENMMAGDPWTGEADIRFTLRNTAYSADVTILD